MSNSFEKGMLLNYLKSLDKAHAMKLELLSYRLHISERDIKEYVRQLRSKEEGNPISGNNSIGYYWASRSEDLQEKINTIEHQLITLGQTLRALKAQQEEMKKSEVMENLA